MSEKKSLAIGIDLGTTYSAVGIWQNGKVEIIANDQGNRTTPSYVAFNETERLIGESAKNQVTSNHTNTIYDVKRLIGYKYTDPIIQNELKEKYSFYFNDKRSAAMVLAKMKSAQQEVEPIEKVKSNISSSSSSSSSS